MNYAIINNDIVIAIVGIYPENDHKYPVVLCHANVRVNDTYADGAFYRDRVKVKSPAEIAEDESTENTAALMDEIESLCNELIGE